MSAGITWHEHLSVGQVAGVVDVLDRVSAHDGVSPLSEHAYLHLLAGGGHSDRHVLAFQGGQLVGYAHLSGDDLPVSELFVDPAARGHGVGRTLLSALRERGGPETRIWAHGQLPAALALAHSSHLRTVRTLCRYVRSLADLPPVPKTVSIRTFEDADSQAWLDLNAKAFADLPDQGSWTLQDLEQRRSQPWFDPRGFLLAFDDDGLVGCHWTKVHGGEGHDHERIGEVYVLAVAPRAQGRGLGAELTLAGLRYLRDLGLDRVMLYVDAQNDAAVNTYERLGFTRDGCDVQYSFGPDVGQVSGKVDA